MVKFFRLENCIVTLLFFIGTSASAETLRVYLDWFPNIEFAGIYAAIDKGWYREAGIDLQMVFEGLDIIPGVLEGKADIGMDSAHNLIRHIGKGERLKAFSAQYQLNPNCIVVPKDSPIRSVKDFKGKTLGIFSPQEVDMYRVMLGYHGLNIDDVKLKPITTFKEKELVELLRKKEVDGFIAWEFNWTITFALLGYEVRVFPGYENGFHYYGIVYFAKDEYIRTHRGLLKKFLEVTFRGWREVFRRPEYYAKFVVDKKYPADRYINGSKDLTLRQQLTELKLRKRYFIEGVGESGMGRMSLYNWTRSLEIAKRYELIPKVFPVNAADLFDGSIMKEIEVL